MKSIICLFGISTTLVFWPYRVPAPHAQTADRSPIPAQENLSQTLAIVFKYENGRRNYVGTALNPNVPAGVMKRYVAHLGGKATTSVPVSSQAEYEIWVAADGLVSGLRYASRKRLLSVIGPSLAASRGVPDGGAGQRIISNATIPSPLPQIKPDTTQQGQWPDPPAELATLCRNSNVICVGRIAGIQRNAHTPVEGNSSNQHTVFVMAVEEYLKEDSANSAPVAKIRMNGGRLGYPGFRGRGTGAGCYDRDDPHPELGKRYLLFLKGLASPQARALGYVHGSVGNVSGKIAELDEYRCTDHWRGKLLLQDNRAIAPAALGSPTADHWRFESGPQICDVSETEAIEAVRLAVSTEAAAKRQSTPR